ncbi:MAG: succinate dehydrogenase/fumarate reductase iron-sulfur subunit [Nitrososphaerota archaeon]|nr:succinate dehydrogenase/fumarate reductase iron-sulfur subunit [Nitrososphaerota archaeon]
MVKLRIFRFNPSKWSQYYMEYDIPTHENMTILDALLYIKEELDPSLTFRYACKAGLCGSCGIKVNGRETLACQTRIEWFGEGKVTLEPLSNYPIIRDLVVDHEELFKKHASVKPYIIRNEEGVDKEYLQTPNEREEFVQAATCINCGLCYSACPTVSIDRRFLGPHALAQAYRYIMDNRDSEPSARLTIVDTLHGVWRCHFIGSCSHVCPKGVDPALLIQRVKRFFILSERRLKRRRPAPLKS